MTVEAHAPKYRRMLSVTAASWILTMITILAAISGAVTTSAIAYQLIAKADAEIEDAQAERDYERETREREVAAANAERDAAVLDGQCRAAIGADTGNAALDILEAMSGAIEADIRGQSAAPLADKLASARATIVSARESKDRVYAECITAAKASTTTTTTTTTR